MKKINAFHVFIAGIVFFALALLDSVLREADNFSDLSHVGKTFVVLCCVCLAYLAYKGLVLPVIKWIKK